MIGLFTRAYKARNGMFCSPTPVITGKVTKTPTFIYYPLSLVLKEVKTTNEHYPVK